MLEDLLDELKDVFDAEDIKWIESCRNTPGTRGWSRLRDRTLAVAKNCAKMTFFSGAKKKLPKKNIYFLQISSSYAKILGETIFHVREIPRNGLKVEGVERRKKKGKKSR